MRLIHRHQKALILAVVLVSSVLLHAKPGIVKWPGPLREYASADRRYVLRNVDPHSGEAPHKLFLRDKVLNREVELLQYDRWVEALWSPAGPRLIINDHGGSNFAECHIYDFNRGLEPIILDADMLRIMPSDRDVFLNHHVYAECREWLDSNRVKIKLHGHGDQDPDGFTLWLEYTLGQGSTVTKRIRTKK